MARRHTLAVAAALVGMGACGGSGGDDDAALVDPSVVARVEARDNRFVPETIEVQAGTTVQFDNVGRNEHNVLPAEGTPEDITVDTADLEPGMVAERRLTEPGTYTYYCSLHGTASAGMTGTIVVTG